MTVALDEVVEDRPATDLDADAVARTLLWVLIPLAGVVWTISHYGSTWFYFDEWLMLDRATRGWGGIFDDHNGHLLTGNFLLYKAQAEWFGLSSPALVFAGLCASLVALQVSVSLVLHRLGVPVLLALLAGGYITYFGPGGETSVYQFNQAHNFALAASFLAGFVALGERRDRSRALVVGALLVVAVLSSSALGALGVVYAAVILTLRWPRRLTLVALAPTALLLAVWLVTGAGSDPGHDTTVGRAVVFTGRLV